MGSLTTRTIPVRQQLFSDAYIANGMNATEAARSAGYKGTSSAQLQAMGSRVLKSPLVRAYIDAQVKQEGVRPSETLGVLLKHMRGDMTDFVTREGAVELDLVAARSGKRLGLLKKFKQRETGFRDKEGVEHFERTVEIELYSAQAAAVELAKVLGLYRKKDDESKRGRVRSAQEMLELCVQYGLPKEKWPNMVKLHHAMVMRTKAVKSKVVK